VTAACVVCGGRFRRHRVLRSRLRSIPLGLDRGVDAEAIIDRCDGCGLLRTRQENQPSPQGLYEDRSISLEASHAKALQFRSRQVYSDDELNFLGPPPGRLLDVGCSTGYFLAKAKEAGWDAVGTEIDCKAADIARTQFNLDVRCGSVQSLSFSDREFDAITLWGVLEHLPEPVADLRHLAQLSKPGGVIIVAVPNVRSLNCAVSRISHHGWDMFLEPGHLHHFSIETLTQLAARAGLRAVSWGTMTCAIRGKLPFLPARWPAVERYIDSWDRDRKPFRVVYRALLRALDAARLGDILVVSFKPSARP
jgi:2-polyprenyl-3-methyl-5-hydroxy-6-metoxy-1,4-benzoquinol methylase